MFPPGEQGQGAHLGPAGPPCPGTRLERAAVRHEEGEHPPFLQECRNRTLLLTAVAFCPFNVGEQKDGADGNDGSS